MAKINRHGLKITGLKTASGKTCACSPYEAGYYEVFYNLDNGSVWTVYRYSSGFNCRAEESRENVIRVCSTREHLTMQEIADRIADAAALFR